MNRRHRILLVTRNLPPLTGGMERLNWHLVNELAAKFEVHVIGPDGCIDQLPPGAVGDACFSGQPAPVFLAQSLYRTLRIAKKIQPDLILAGSGVTAPHAVLAAQSRKCPTLAYLHGLDIVADHILYRRGFLPFIRRCSKIMVNSHNTGDLATAAGIRPDRINVLHPGVTVPEESSILDVNAYRQNIGAGGRPILISVGRLTHRKGLVEFVTHSLPRIVDSIPGALLLVVGGEADQKLAGASTGVGRAIKMAAAAEGLSSHVQLMGRVDEPTLAQAFAASDVHIFPVRALRGDVEGFGMVAVEAAAHGVPTIAFDVGGIREAIDPDRSGILVAPEDYIQMADTIVRCLNNKDRTATATACREFAKKLSWTHFGTQARRIVGTMIDNTQDQRESS